MIALWIYIGLLLAGGLMGFIKAKSKISLYMATGFGVALSLCAAGLLPLPVANGLLGVLLLVFLQRWLKTKKLMPAGIMFGITLLVLAIRLAPAGLLPVR